MLHNTQSIGSLSQLFQQTNKWTKKKSLGQCLDCSGNRRFFLISRGEQCLSHLHEPQLKIFPYELYWDRCRLPPPPTTTHIVQIFNRNLGVTCMAGSLVFTVPTCVHSVVNATAKNRCTIATSWRIPSLSSFVCVCVLVDGRCLWRPDAAIYELYVSACAFMRRCFANFQRAQNVQNVVDGVRRKRQQFRDAKSICFAMLFIQNRTQISSVYAAHMACCADMMFTHSAIRSSTVYLKHISRILLFIPASHEMHIRLIWSCITWVRYWAKWWPTMRWNF